MDSPSLPFRESGKANVAQLLRVLPDEESRNVFLLNAWLERKCRWKGAEYHCILAEWLAVGSGDERELIEWMSGKEWAWHHTGRELDHARFQADLWVQNGIWAAVWCEPSHVLELFPNCPRVLYGVGRKKEWGEHHAAVFNSRKSKSVGPDTPWLCFLREHLGSLMEQDVGVAGSVGTLTHDLVTAWACAKRRPLFLVSPFPAEELDNLVRSVLSLDDGYPGFALACTTRAVQCPKANRMTCRDRLLAALSDLHVIAEIRSGGNLLGILENQQRICNRSQWIFIPKCKNKSNEGNFILTEKFSGSVERLSPEESAHEPTGGHGVSKDTTGPEEPPAHEIQWGEFLYHYTRGCPGPWPGQTYGEYLRDLLAGERWSGHTALDTLMRILLEGRIRAGGKLVREGRAVVSLSARPPQDIASMRKWNPALIRWTVEPYGIAVRRSVLKSMGAKPVIYAKDEHFQILSPSNRFRFQRHVPPGCLWKQEREWRLPKDLVLRDVSPGDVFILVGTPKDRAALQAVLSTDYRIVVLPPALDTGQA